MISNGFFLCGHRLGLTGSKTVVCKSTPVVLARKKSSEKVKMMGHKGKIFCALSKTQNMCSWPPKGRNFVAYSCATHRHKRRRTCAAAAAPTIAVIHPLVPVASYVHRVFHNILILLKKISKTPRVQKMALA